MNANFTLLEFMRDFEYNSNLSWKKKAEEQGKIAETKLTVPLAMELVALIMITLMPALLEM